MSRMHRLAEPREYGIGPSRKSEPTAPSGCGQGNRGDGGLHDVIAWLLKALSARLCQCGAAIFPLLPSDPVLRLSIRQYIMPRDLAEAQ